MFSCIWYCSNLPAASTIPAPKFLTAPAILPITFAAMLPAEKFKIVDKSNKPPFFCGWSITPANFLASAVVFANWTSVFFNAVVSTCFCAKLFVAAISFVSAAAVAFNVFWSAVTFLICASSLSSSGLPATCNCISANILKTSDM